MISRPARHRVFAAATLMIFAIASALFWNGGAFDPVLLGGNLLVACIGFLVLHHRWKQREKRAVSSTNLKDIFS
ncbi:MAG: hypothetical protein V2J51_09315 [Erythrobacter sp.]|jgi:uncharacterized membrane protein|nr:hypothetical protein [Erythrobacter sp.]